MVKVLNIVHTLNSSGVAAVIYNNYRYIDQSKIQFTIISQRGKEHGEKIDFFEKKFREIGVKIFFVPVKAENLKGNICKTKEIMQSEKYDIVHIHMEEGAATYVALAKFCGIKIRIVHAHLAYPNREILKQIRNVFLKMIVNLFVTHRFACGEFAAESMWGKKMIRKGKVTIINNAVDSDKFDFDRNIREKVRKDLNIDNSFVIGNVARMTYQKNHKFLISLFNNIVEKCDNSILILVGTGVLIDEVKNQIKVLGLEKYVLLLGERDDIAELMQAFDVLLLPSLFEGFPIVGIEAQAASLPCVFSNKITKLVNITNKCDFIDLNESLEEWSYAVIKYRNSSERVSVKNEIVQSGYDLKMEAKKLEWKYIELLRNE